MSSQGQGFRILPSLRGQKMQGLPGHALEQSTSLYINVVGKKIEMGINELSFLDLLAICLMSCC